MTLYTVHEPAARRADDVVFVKDGFSWPALFLPLLWQIYHGMWLVLALYLAIGLGLEYGLGLISETLSGIAALCFALLFALEANDLRRWHLARKGYAMSTIISGRNLEEAERRYFAARRLDEPVPERAPTRAASIGVLMRGEPIGLFPRAGGGA